MNSNLIRSSRGNGWSRRQFLGSLTKGAAGATAYAAFGAPRVKPASVTTTFSVGYPIAELLTQPGATGCAINFDGEPSIHVSADNLVLLGSERGLGGGSDVWRGVGQVGGSGAAACALEYRGQPNAVADVGASGGDIDLAIASARNALGNYNLYVASLNLGSVAVANSPDNGSTWTNVPVQGGLPGDDREWIAAYGASTSLLSFHDIATFNINVLRSDDGGLTYAQIAQVLSPLDYRTGANQHGNIVIDRRNTAGTAANAAGLPSFWAYTGFVAPSTATGQNFNEFFLGVSNDGGFTWNVFPIPCSVSNRDLAHEFPILSVAPNGTLWAAWSDGANVFTAVSGDHGQTWNCSSRVSTNTVQALMPWLVATSAGIDLVYYGTTTTGSSQVWFVYFVQNLLSTVTGWGTPLPLVPVHQGPVCEGGFLCSGNRQLLDDFGIDTDQLGWAHIGFSHDAASNGSPQLGGPYTVTGYAVQTSGARVGLPN